MQSKSCHKAKQVHIGTRPTCLQVLITHLSIAAEPCVAGNDHLVAFLSACARHADDNIRSEAMPGSYDQSDTVYDTVSPAAAQGQPKTHSWSEW